MRNNDSTTILGLSKIKNDTTLHNFNNLPDDTMDDFK
jgi:hypothetical protein